LQEECSISEAEKGRNLRIWPIKDLSETEEE